MRDAQKIESYVIDSQSVPYVALLRPKQVRIASTDEDCRALIDSAIHFTVVDPAQDLAPFKAVVIPDASKVGDGEVAGLRRYVEGGGRLLVMGRPGDELAKMAGIRIQGETEPSYIRVDPKTLPSPPAMDVYTYANVSPAEPLENTKVLAPLVWQLQHGTRFTSRRQSPPDDKVSGLAAITWSRQGEGQVVYSATPLIQVYGTWGYTAMREILADLLDYLIPPSDRLLDVKAPVPLEVSLNRQLDRLIVHLVHCPQSRLATCSWKQEDYVHHQPIVSGSPTVTGTKLNMPAKLVRGRKIRLVPDGPELHATTADGVATITVPDFQIRAVLVIE